LQLTSSGVSIQVGIAFGSFKHVSGVTTSDARQIEFWLQEI